MLEIYAELVLLGAATQAGNAWEPTPQAFDLAWSLLPEGYLAYLIQKRI